MEALLGSKLQGKDNAVLNTADALGGKEVVALYFSAHWCPPCRGFTPKFAEVYKQLTEAGKPLEVVFVSSDKEQSQFDEYFGEMPWLALPYEERDKKAELSKKYKVQGIPSVILLNGQGELITKDGRSAVSAPEDFPWIPPTVDELLSVPLVKSGSEETVSVESIKSAGKYLGLYFSAHWCPPCKAFTPKLAKLYKTMQEAGKPFEVVFVSSDKDQDQFDEYFKEMPWLALPFPERKNKEKLSSRFGVQGIPTLVILDPELKVVNPDGCGAVGSDIETGANFPWHPKKVSELENVDPNECPLLLVLEEEAADHWDDVEKALETVAEEVLGKLGPEDEKPMAFAYAQETGGMAGQVRKVTKLGKPGSQPEMIILDCPDEGGFYVHSGEVTVESMRAFLEGYNAKTLTRQQM